MYNVVFWNVMVFITDILVRGPPFTIDNNSFFNSLFPWADDLQHNFRWLFVNENLKQGKITKSNVSIYETRKVFLKTWNKIIESSLSWKYWYQYERSMKLAVLMSLKVLSQFACRFVYILITINTNFWPCLNTWYSLTDEMWPAKFIS